jgi:hypothetical protein
VSFAPDVPREALRDLAGWRLGAAHADAIAHRARGLSESSYPTPPTVRNPAIRKAWSKVMALEVTTAA